MTITSVGISPTEYVSSGVIPPVSLEILYGAMSPERCSAERAVAPGVIRVLVCE